MFFLSWFLLISLHQDPTNRKVSKGSAPERSKSFRYYLPTPPLGQDMTQGQFLSGV